MKCSNGIFITNNIADMHALMFADDVSTIADTVVKLQNQIKIVHEFCEETGMKLNIDKSKFMVFRRGGQTRSNEKWTFNGKELEVVAS